MRTSTVRNRATDDRPPRPITIKAAERLGAFKLARLWADPNAWQLDDRTAHDELAELAVMSALGKLLHDWQPIAIHGAMRAGARPEAVASAVGSDVQDTYQQWREWAEHQRDLVYDGGKLGLSPEEYDSIERRFVVAGACVAGAGLGKRVA